MKTPFTLSVLGLTLSLWSLLWLVICVFFAVDFWQRYREFKRVRSRLLANTDTLPSLIERKRHTRCQRELMIAAAEQVFGSGRFVKARYYSMGYRWWHIHPDWMFTDPLMFFRPTWWAAFLGLKK